MNSNSDENDSSGDDDDDEDDGEGSTGTSLSNAVGSQVDQAGASQEVDDDDDIVQAFRRAQNVQRDHPPDITCEDFITDISFNPNSNVIAAGTIVGDVFL
jgi:hypothetical protein